MSKCVLLMLIAQVTADDTLRSRIGTGRSFSFVVDDDGKLNGAGSDESGQLGINGNETVVKNFARTELDGTVRMVAAGAFHSLYLMDDNTVFGSGDNNNGQLALSSREIYRSPVLISRDAIAVAAGYKHSLFLMSNGTVFAAGNNNVGQLGDGTTTERATYTPVQGLSGTVSAIAAGYDFSYFLMDDGRVFATGQNLGGQLGDGTMKSKLLPTEMQIKSVSAMAAGQSHGLFIAEGRVLCTGANHLGQCGDRDHTRHAKPMPITLTPGDQPPTRVFAGGDSSCVIDSAYRASLFGSNADGQIGAEEQNPVDIGQSTVSGVFEASLGESHGLLLLAQGFVWASGKNAHGELGTGMTTSTNQFMKVMELLPLVELPAPPAPPAPSPGREPEKGEPFPVILIVLFAVVGVAVVALGIYVAFSTATPTAESQQMAEMSA